MWGRRKARANCCVSKSLMDAGRGPECRSAAANPTICGKCAQLSEIGRKVVTLEYFTERTTLGLLECGFRYREKSHIRPHSLARVRPVPDVPYQQYGRPSYECSLKAAFISRAKSKAPKGVGFSRIDGIPNALASRVSQRVLCIRT